MRKKNRKLGRGLESLEQKAMMAGDVAVVVDGGDLSIFESGDDIGENQQIVVTQLKGNKVRVEGLGKTDIDALIIDGRNIPLRAGTNSVEVPVTDDIDINLGGGADDVYFSSAGGGVKADKVEIDTGSGNDYVSISGLKTRGNLEIDTRSGHDDVLVSNSLIGDSGGEDLKIDTGSGADDVRVSVTTVRDDVDVDMYEDSSEADVDKLELNNVVADDVFADLGNGRDEARLLFSTIADDVKLDLGDDDGGLNDNDYAFVGFNDIGDRLQIDGEDGDDEVRFAHNDIGGEVEFNGGDGVNEFFYWTVNGNNSNNVGYYDLNDAVFRTYGY